MLNFSVYWNKNLNYYRANNVQTQGMRTFDTVF